MSAVDEALTDLVERVRRRPAERWLVRAAMLAFGTATQLWIGGGSVGSPATVLAWCAIAAGVALPRTVLPLVAAGFFVVEAAVTGLDPLAAVPVAIGMAGWHLCAVRLSVGRPWSRVGPAARRALWRPATVGLAGIALALPPALLAAGLVLPELAAVTMLLVVGVVLGAVVVLWPGDAAAR